MNCPSCQNKAKEVNPDHIICTVCGDISRIEGEWVLTETVPEPVPAGEPVPVPEPVPAGEPVPATDSDNEIGRLMSRCETDAHWLNEVTVSLGGGQSE